ncbi:hypothetical protein LTS08_007350 [Lithohypha guttulata]|nr:hypothetical protein LTS08_007350 [Lithohypha guttulata]
MAGLIQLRGRNLYRLMKFVCGVAFMMYGYDAGVLGGLLLHRPFLDAIGNPTGEWTIALISSSYSLAACVTTLVVAPFTFRLGRRGTILLGNFAAIIGSVIQASSYSVAQLIIGRVVTGFAIGCISSAVPTYLSETGMEIGDRGPANAINAILLISGVPLAYWIDYGFVQYDGQFSWRVPIIFQCVFAITSGGCMFFLPDTPRWYFARNRNELGEDALCRLTGLTIEDPKVQETKREIFLAMEAEEEAKSSLRWTQFVTMGITDKTPLRIVRRLVICFWLPFIREWTGSSMLAYYSTVTLSQAGASPKLVSLLAGVQNMIFAAGCVPLYFTVEKLGRRTILLWCAILMSILMLIFVVLQGANPSQSMQWASIAIIWVFLFFMSWGWQGCVWLYCSEIPPLSYRHVGGSITAFGEWLSTFLFVMILPVGLENIKWRFWIFVLSGNVLAVVFVYFLCPETGGKTLEQIDYIFSKPGVYEEDAKGGIHHVEEVLTETKIIVLLFVQVFSIHRYTRFSHGLLSTTLRYIAVNDPSLQMAIKYESTRETYELSRYSSSTRYLFLKYTYCDQGASIEFSVFNTSSIILELANTNAKSVRQSQDDSRSKTYMVLTPARAKSTPSGPIDIVVTSSSRNLTIAYHKAVYGVVPLAINLEQDVVHDLKIVLSGIHEHNTMQFKSLWLSRGGHLIHPSRAKQLKSMVSQEGVNAITLAELGSRSLSDIPQRRLIEVLGPTTMLGLDHKKTAERDIWSQSWPSLLEHEFPDTTVARLAIPSHSCLTQPCQRKITHNSTTAAVQELFFRAGTPGTDLYARLWPFSSYDSVPSALVLVLGLADVVAFLDGESLNKSQARQFLNSFSHAYSTFIQTIRRTAYSKPTSSVRRSISQSELQHTIDESYLYSSSSSTIPIFLVLPPIPPNLPHPRAKQMQVLLSQATSKVLDELKWHIGDKKTFVIDTAGWLNDADFTFDSNASEHDHPLDYSFSRSGHVKFAHRLSTHLCYYLVDSTRGGGQDVCPFHRHDEYIGNLYVPETASIGMIVEERKIAGIKEFLGIL